MKSTGIKTTNEVGLTVFGFGGSVGQSQNIDGDLKASDYKSFNSKSQSLGIVSSKITEETSSSGQTTTKQETGITIGFKFIIGVELKIQTETQQK